MNNEILNLLTDIFEVCIIPLLGVLTFYLVNFIKVKGHADNEKNNRCDFLATNEIAKFKSKKEN